MGKSKSTKVNAAAVKAAVLDYFSSAHGRRLFTHYTKHVHRLDTGLDARNKELSRGDMESSARIVESYEESAENLVLAKLTQGQADMVRASDFNIGSIMRLASLVVGLF
jgi:hypothetical protein